MENRANITILSPVGSYRHPNNYTFMNALAGCGHFNVRLFEVFGISEVARARNFVASLGYEHIKKVGGYVFWLDADMALTSLDVFMLHLSVVRLTQKAISGRYVRRQDDSKLAASLDENEKRGTLKVEGDAFAVTLTPAMTGLGVLLMPAKLFLDHADNSPVCERKEKGIDFREILMCCPTIEQNDSSGFAMVSEDFDYCSKIEGGSWLVEVHLKQSGERVYLDYGHMAERMLLHNPNKSHTLRDDR
jgi:hypothetical protein